ncbi:hypothetical protein Patl1_30845 [Pistacia atlantica]|uniref:Uncharacterized protein n=1 Tax=Pistacia atlantica TaxID=434234 RepID=A0ACC1ADS9_9ROSI|nr:hypothetical protein Patl1_30845 [Pistacia atlantica]
MTNNLSFISNFKPLKPIFHLLLLAITLTCANAARILTKDDTPQPIPQPLPEFSNLIPTPVTGMAPVAGTVTTPQIATSSVTVAKSPLSFFMHDILGGTAPSGMVVDWDQRQNKLMASLSPNKIAGSFLSTVVYLLSPLTMA